MCIRDRYKVPQVKKFGFVKPTHVDMVDDGRSLLMYFNLNHLHLAHRAAQVSAVTVSVCVCVAKCWEGLAKC